MREREREGKGKIYIYFAPVDWLESLSRPLGQQRSTDWHSRSPGSEQASRQAGRQTTVRQVPPLRYRPRRGRPLRRRLRHRHHHR